MLSRSIFILTVLAAGVGCKAAHKGTVPTSEVASDLSTKECIPIESIDFSKQLVEFQRIAGSPDTCTPAGTPPPTRVVVNGRPVCKSGGLNLGEDEVSIGSRWYTIFVWPDDMEENLTLDQRYEQLEMEMKAYASLVGTCLHREPEGAGENDWLSAGGKRWKAREEVYQAALRTKDPAKWCAAVRKSFVESFVIGGSDFCQYGNCSEGGRVGACLARHFGFSDKEIKLCSSANDHRFALVRDKIAEENRNCILDRWQVIGNYRCGVDLDTRTSEVIVRSDDNKWESAGKKWLQHVTCQTIADYVRDPERSTIPK